MYNKKSLPSGIRKNAAIKSFGNFSRIISTTNKRIVKVVEIPHRHPNNSNDNYQNQGSDFAEHEHIL